MLEWLEMGLKDGQEAYIMKSFEFDANELVF